MPKLINIKGQKFGKWTVLEKSSKSKKWVCRCECGNIKEVVGAQLRNGTSTNCGCVGGHYKHGLKGTRIYNIWNAMKQRCNNPNTEGFKNYGGRGIKVCEEWEKDVKSFHDWAINNGYEDNLTLERNDINGNYEPFNCSWKTMKEQANNKRNNHLIEFEGQIKTISEWSEIKGISKELILERIKRDIKKEKLFEKPKKRIEVKATINGIEKTVSEWSEISGISHKTIKNRIKAGWKEEDLLKPVKRNYKRTD